MFQSVPRPVVLVAVLGCFLAAGCGSQADKKKDPPPDDKTMQVTMEITGMS